MGMSMASVAFRRCENWETTKAEIEKMLLGVSGLTNNLQQDHVGYAIVSPRGDQGAFLARLAAHVSLLTGDYAVMATCVDSDFNILELYRGGELVERSCVGRIYKEFFRPDELNKPDFENWKPLLQDSAKERKLRRVLNGRALFAENQLRKLSALTDLPIFDDVLVFGE